MQRLKSTPRAIRRGLIAASCALLGVARAKGQQLLDPALSGDGTPVADRWVIGLALSYYQEKGRIRVIEPIVSAVKDFQNGQVVNLHFSVDSLTGASPNGAVTSFLPQTFAGPSGKVTHNYTTPPGDLPVDPFYHDVRIAASGSWQLPLSRVTSWTVGAKVSYEHDFLSLTGDTSIARNFDQDNTTLSLGVYDENDTIRPIGGVPVPGSDTSFAEKERISNESRNDIGALIGVSQVMNRHWLAQVNVSLDRASGYMNDPYKIMSVVESEGITTGYLYERRPAQRTRASVYVDNRVGWQRQSVDLSLRYFGDDWGVRSYTARVRYRWWNADQGSYWQPSLRWYRQTAADFYHPWMSLAEVGSLSSASADSRLGAFHALTYGLEYGIDIGTPYVHPKWLTVRVQYYRQMVDARIPGPGALAALNLYPGLTAIQAQVTYRF